LAATGEGAGRPDASAIAFVVVALAGLVGRTMWRPVAVVVATPWRAHAAEIVYASGVVEPRIWAKVTPLVRERIVDARR
jgi:membrane fusion protein (multidrug efflux system)